MKSYNWLMEHAPLYEIGRTSGLPDKQAGKFLHEGYMNDKRSYRTKKRNFNGGSEMAYRRRGYRKRYRRFSRGARRGYGGKAGLSLSPAFIVGALAGLTHIDDKVPKQLVLIAATAPVRGVGTIKAVAQGMILGNVLQGIREGGLSSTGFQGVG